MSPDDIERLRSTTIVDDCGQVHIDAMDFSDLLDAATHGHLTGQWLVQRVQFCDRKERKQALRGTGA